MWHENICDKVTGSPDIAIVGYPDLWFRRDAKISVRVSEN